MERSDGNIELSDASVDYAEVHQKLPSELRSMVAGSNIELQSSESSYAKQKSALGKQKSTLGKQKRRAG